MTKIKIKIIELVKKNKGIGYSDIAAELNMDLKKTVRLCTELEAERKIEAY